MSDTAVKILDVGQELLVIYAVQRSDPLNSETDQRSGGIDSKRPGIKPNADGRYTIFVGPKAPKGRENTGPRLFLARAST